MKTLIIGNITTFGHLFMAGFMLYVYFNPKQEKTYKKWWVLAGVIIWTGLAANSFYLYYNKYQANKIPDESAIIKAMTENSNVAKTTKVFTSDLGYSLIIPAGFHYTTDKVGPVSLMANKKADNNAGYAISVVILKPTMPINRLIADNLAQTKKQLTNLKQQTETIPSGRRVTFNGMDGEMMTTGVFQVSKKNGLLYTLSIMAKNIDQPILPDELAQSLESFTLQNNKQL